MGTARGSGRSGHVRSAARCDGQRRSVARENAGGGLCWDSRRGASLHACAVGWRTAQVKSRSTCNYSPFMRVCTLCNFCCTARLVLYFLSLCLVARQNS